MDAASVSEFFLKLFLILVSAKVMAEIFAHLGLPAVIGEVVAGVLVGPSVMGLIGPEPTFILLAQIGMLLLLFEVGVDTDVGRLVEVGGQSVMVAATGVVLPFILGYAASHYVFGLAPAAAAFIGGTLVATSIGITLRVLKDIGRQRSHAAQVVLGSAVLDDVVGVVILAVLLEYTVEGRFALASSLRVLGFVAVFLIAAPALSRVFVSFMSKADELSKTSGILTTIVVSFILILSVVAHDLGAPEIIGAFAAGLAMTRKPPFGGGGGVHGIRYEVVSKAEEKTTPIGELFIPVFFVMVGVSINFRVIDFGSGWFWAFAGLMAAVAFLSKLASGAWVKGPFTAKLAVGVAMVPRGEVGLIFAGAGLRQGIFDDAVYASMVFVVALTTLFAPALLKTVMSRGKTGV